MSKSAVLKISALSTIPLVLYIVGFILAILGVGGIGAILLLLSGLAGFVLWIVLIIIVAKDASQRNKNAVVFALLPFFLGFIGGFIYYAMISSEAD